MVRWTAFADLLFADCAWLAFARAAELAETDVHEQHRGAWVIDDRRVQLSLEYLETGAASLAGMKRFLGLLALQAIDGEVRVDVSSPPECWVRGPALASGRAERSVSGMGESGPLSRTLRTEAHESGVSGLDPLDRLFASNGTNGNKG